MKLNMSMSQRRLYKLIMTSKMEQSLYMLQAPITDIAEYLQHKANENPFLHSELAADSYVSSVPSERGSDPGTLALYGSGGLLANVEDQLILTDCSEALRRKTVFLAGNLDEAGYLRIDLGEAAAFLNCSIEDVEQALELLQSFEPAGIGARDLRECLLLQIARDCSAAPYAEDIIKRFLQDLAEGTALSIQQKLKITKDELETAIDYIRGLDPRPASFYTEPELLQIVPEAEITWAQDQLEVRLLDKYMPIVSLNEDYLEILSRQDMSPELKEQWFEAQSLIANLERRKQTLRQVILTVVNAQKYAFKEGLTKLNPFLLKDAASALQLHESTVSRAIQNKYIQTDFGVIPIKVLFSKSIRTADGQGVSVPYVKSRIAAMVRQEDRQKTISDAEIAERLKEEGIRISRRTVAQYRQSLNIKNSSQRNQK